jgi:hypothetical protein
VVHSQQISKTLSLASDKQAEFGVGGVSDEVETGVKQLVAKEVKETLDWEDLVNNPLVLKRNPLPAAKPAPAAMLAPVSEPEPIVLPTPAPVVERDAKVEYTPADACDINDMLIQQQSQHSETKSAIARHVKDFTAAPMMAAPTTAPTMATSPAPKSSGGESAIRQSAGKLATGRPPPPSVPAEALGNPLTTT